MGSRCSSCSSNDSVECKAEDTEEKDIWRTKPAGIECVKNQTSVLAPCIAY
jgi:hypothetical protein